MPRQCTVCASPNRDAIDQALVSGASFRDVAARFGPSRSALARHRQEHLGPLLLAAQEEHEQLRVGSIMAEFERLYATVKMLQEACDRWLRDPDDPGRYALEPRGGEVVICETHTADGTTRRVRRPLSEILAQLEAAGMHVLRVETTNADPRELILKTSQQLTRQLALLVDMYETVHAMEQVELFQTAVLTAIGGVSPETREAIIADLRRTQPLRGILPV